ncbi:MAG TPA: tRNA-dihydrouridine synthase [Candidatus Saccharimonadales bacterium]|jgi:tRNA-dihydrouridine synthase
MTDQISLPKPFFILAPMDDVTDTVFRQVIIKCASPDLFITEFTNVDGLQSPGRSKVQTKLQHTDVEQPLIAQLWGLKSDNFKLSAQQIVEGQFGEFKGIDLNMGCPVKDIIKNGACSALINNRDLAAEIIQSTKDGAGGKLPISVKTRLGFSEVDFSWHEFLLKQGIDMLVVHGRTKVQMSKVPADWSSIGEIRKLRDKISPNTLIVGNGDVLSRAQGKELAKKYKLDGVMIGRAIFNDPFIFSSSSPWQNYSSKQKVELYKTHVQLFDEIWGNTKPVQVLNKFCKVYVNNFDGASELREKLMAAKDLKELKSLINDSLIGDLTYA